MAKQNCGNTQIVGASFSLYPICDRFGEIILDTLEKVDTSKVWLKTDDVTTTVRGKAVHVFDVTGAAFLHAAQTGEHVAFQATYSVGCPGDSAGDVYLSKDDAPVNVHNTTSIKQYIAAKFSLYPLGGGNYMDVIYEQIEAMKDFVSVSPAHYSTKLTGDATAVFRGLEKVFNAAKDAGSSHTVMTVTISANSPSHQDVDIHA